MANSSTFMNDRLYSILNTQNGTLNTWSAPKEENTKITKNALNDYAFNGPAPNANLWAETVAKDAAQENAYKDAVVSALNLAASQQTEAPITQNTALFSAGQAQPVDNDSSLTLFKNISPTPSTTIEDTDTSNNKTQTLNNPKVTSKDLQMQVTASLDKPYGADPNWELEALNLKANLSRKNNNKKYLDTHGVSSEGIPYEIKNGKYLGYAADSDIGKGILRKLNNIKSEGENAVATDEEASLADNLAKVSSKQQYVDFINQNKGILSKLSPEETKTAQEATNAGALAKNDPYESANPLLRNGSANEIFQIADELNKQVNGAGNALTGAQLQKATDALNILKTGLIEDLDKSTAVFGSVEDAQYAFEHPNASSDTVAKKILDQYGVSGTKIKGIAAHIDKVKKLHPELTNAAIGMAMKTCLQTKNNNEFWARETDLTGSDADDLSVRDTEFGKAIQALISPTSSTNWQKAKKAYLRANNFAQDVNDFTKNISITQQAVDKQLKNATYWAGDVKDPDILNFINQTNIDATNKSKALVDTLNTLSKRIGDDYLNVPSTETSSKNSEE